MKSINKLNFKISIIIINLALISYIALTDPRSFFISEPYEITLHAISIAISRLVYGIDNFYGLKEVYLNLKSIPHPSLFFSDLRYLLEGQVYNFKSLNEISEYNILIQNTITSSLDLKIISENDLHDYQNDMGYPIFVTAAFYLFGFSMKSVSILFLTIFLFSIFIYLSNFFEDNLSLFLIFLITSCFSLILLINFGGDVQSVGTINQRFISILALVPSLFISLMIVRKEKYTIFNYICLFFQIIILSLILEVRGTAIWGVFYLIIFLMTIFVLKLRKINFVKKLNLTSLVFIFLTFFIISQSTNYIITKSLGDRSQEHSITKHMFWHSLFIGISNSPKIYEKYVCLDDEKIIAKYKYKIPTQDCEKFNSIKKADLKSNILLRNSDLHGISAVIRHLNNNKINQPLGIVNKKAIEWKLDWTLYEQTLKTIYFNIIKNNPIEFFYIQFIIKPLEILYDIMKSAYYFYNFFSINFYANFFISLTILTNLILGMIIFNKEKKLIIKKDEQLLLFVVFGSSLLAVFSIPFSFYPYVGAVYYEILVLFFTALILQLYIKFRSLKK